MEQFINKLATVYDEGGEFLGDEYVDLSGLQEDTKNAILQLMYLDKTVDIYNDALNKKDAYR